MENGYDLYRQGSSGWTWKTRNEEFQEEDVWGILKETTASDSEVIIGSPKEPSFISRRLPTATRMIPKSINKNPISQEPKITQQSAPVNIPDWSKICGTSSSKNSTSWLYLDSDGDRNGHWESEDEYEEEEDGDRNGDGDVIPPHEYTAKKLARSQTWSFSVYEGAGRTLKGRDLRRVRNAVLSKTGFLESKSDY
ncbi:hypothetical protein CDL12_00541 [Handroanthus impetiginosus]|uniref:Senescence regulator S40 n=1 Tax=Handroanthus impetiginosus TaxID=429701 RepID=A0A2G9IAB4_9LAMI|nr:hypothetical protein CDL12_00541 [Handroanthus impetiginosus]